MFIIDIDIPTCADNKLKHALGGIRHERRKRSRILSYVPSVIYLENISRFAFLTYRYIPQ